MFLNKSEKHIFQITERGIPSAFESKTLHMNIIFLVNHMIYF